MADRKLVHIEKIIELVPIPGADFIQSSKILGWECVVKKGEFKVGDLCAYFEIDAIVPPKPEFEFLKDVKYRVKTRKFKGSLSQGLALPLSILPPGKYKEGDDVTQLCNVSHYDPESNLHASNKEPISENKLLKYLYKTRPIQFLLKYSFFRKLLLPKKEHGAWPKGIQHTDECRLQNTKYDSLREKFKDKKFYVTVKMDGQSGTFFLKRKNGLFKKFYFGVLSRNIWKKKRDNSNYWQVAIKYDIEKALKKAIGDKDMIIVQGEICGPGIQKNPENFTELKFFVFNVITVDLDQQYQYDLEEMEEFCQQTGLQMVPTFKKELELPEDPKELLKMAEGKCHFNPKHEREGLVFRLVENGEKLVSFKAISNKFLLKEEG
jgi:hypothetical protein